MSTEDQPTRKRGVRASRARLNQALAEAGFKSQAALADRMADLEGLDTAPKDLVNRVFREEPVAPRSMERLARALGAEASTLYLSSKDLQAPPGDARPPEPPMKDSAHPRQRRVTTGRMTEVLTALVLLGTVAVWNLPIGTPLGCRVHEFVHPLRAARGQLGIVIARFEHDPANAAQHFLATSLVGDPRLRPYVSVLMTCRTFVLDTTGAIGVQLDALRTEGRQLLRHSGAEMLIWGRADDGQLLVRFVSARQRTLRVSVKIGGRLLTVDESRLQIPLSLRNPTRTLSDIKRVALALISPDTSREKLLRTRAMRALSSVD